MLLPGPSDLPESVNASLLSPWPNPKSRTERVNPEPQLNHTNHTYLQALQIPFGFHGCEKFRSGSSANHCRMPVEGYRAISCPHRGQEWNGLVYNGSQALLTTGGASDRWFYAIGSFCDFQGAISRCVTPFNAALTPFHAISRCVHAISRCFKRHFTLF